MDVYCIVNVNHTEKGAKQSWCQGAALFHAVDNEERFREVAF